jgi:hypothetical protein
MRMPKKTSDGELTIAHAAQGEATPPLLSEKLIAQLQGAVEAARKRMPMPRFVMDHEDERCPNQ